MEESPGYMVDVGALPFGVCSCCERPQALVKGEAGAVCPCSSNAYLLLPDGATLLAEAAPYGVCHCCAPPMPLEWQDGQLVCRAKPGNRYRHVDGQTELVQVSKSTVTPAEALAAVDAALRRNSARVMVNGLFDID